MAAFSIFRSILIMGCGLAAGILPLPANGQTTSVPAAPADTIRVQWERVLPPLTITAGRLPTSPALGSLRITTLDSTTLRETGATSVASLLHARAGFHVRRYGEGGLATPALRGAGASQTALLLDGHRISNPQIGHLDLTLLPTALIESVDVIHGATSALHGSDGLSGAVHIRTLRPPESLEVRGTGTIGAFGERGGSLLAGGPLTEHTSVLTAVDVQSTDGDFPYTDEAQYPTTTVRRQNADRERRSIYSSVRSNMGTHNLRVSGWVTQAERGLPPTSSTAEAQERQWDTHLRLWGQDRVPVGPTVLTVQGMTQHTRLRYANPTQNVDQTGRTRLASLETSIRVPATPHWSAAGGISGSIAGAEHPELEMEPHQEHVAAFGEGTGTYGRLRLYPAVRTDAYWMPGGENRVSVNPRLGLNVQPMRAWPGVHVKAQIGRAFRVPTFNDRYWQPGGNPNLRPERSWGGDVGLRLDRGQGHVELTAFGHLRRDQIVWESTDSGHWAPHNVGRVRVIGGEVSAAWTWSLPIVTPKTGITYTVTDARNRSDPSASSYDEPLRYLPRNQVKAHAILPWGPASLTVHTRYTGRRYVTSDGSAFLNPHVVTDAGLCVTQELADVDTELSLEIDNVFNTDYQSVGGRPMPPRHARVRLLVRP